MTDSLERALYKLDFEVPEGLVDRAVAGGPQAPVHAHTARQIRIATRGALNRAAALVVAVLFVNLVAAYFAPRYGQALADAPIVGGVAGPVLRYSGLDASRITVVNVSSTSAGHTIKLVGGYADTERTVLFMEIDGNPHGLPNKQTTCCYAEGTLVDQFALQYQRIFSPDPFAATFAPLGGPASRVGARLNLHVTELRGLHPEFQPVSGDWSLNVTLIQQAGKVLATPGPVTANGVTYAIKSLRLSGKLLKISLQLTGQPVDEETKRAYGPRNPSQLSGPNAFAQEYFAPKLVDAQGNKASFYDWGYSLPKQGPTWGTIDAVLPGPGQYTLTFGNLPGPASFQIEVP